MSKFRNLTVALLSMAAFIAPPALTTAEPAPDAVAPTPQSVGTAKAEFTTTRVWPDWSVVRWPTSAIGKLTAVDPHSTPAKKVTTCTATLIGPNVLITAGHCVAHAKNPAYPNGY